MKLDASPNFMKKFGDVWRSARNDKLKESLMPTPWYIDLSKYLIDWKTRQKVHLISWLKKQIDSELVKSIVLENEWDNIEDLDKRMFAVFRWVCNRFTYKTDKEIWGTDEHWSTIEESLDIKDGRGDCEDGAVAMFVLARACGIPEDRIKIVTGNVVGGGHCWIVYTANDGAMYCMDWCYWKTFTLFPNRKSLYEQSNYFNGQKIWFGVTDKRGYS